MTQRKAGARAPRKLTIALCTGGRDYKDSDMVWIMLGKLAPDMVLVGDAPGADAIVRAWCTAHRTPCLVFFADWDGNGQAAGPIRNEAMVEAAEAMERGGHRVRCVAFPGGRGTADCVRRVRGLGLQLVACEN